MITIFFTDLFRKQHRRSDNFKVFDKPVSIEMSASQDQNLLLEVSNKLLPKLRDFYLEDWPSHIISFYSLDLLIKRLENYPEEKENFKVLSLGGEVGEDATFIMVQVRIFV